MTTVTIPLSKGKLVLALLLSGVFVAMGIWLWGRASSFSGIHEVKALFGGIMCVVFFGAIGIIQFIKLFDGRAGLVLDEIGIHRMGVLNYHSVIRWDHITHCTVEKVQRTRLLMIHVDNTEEVLSAMNPLARFSQRMMLSRYGAPYSLSSNALKCDFDELKELIEAGIAGWRNRA